MTISPIQSTMHVLHEVLEERYAQDDKWGEQNFPFHWPGDGRGVALTGRSYAAWAELYKAECDRRRDAATAGHADTRSNALVLLEEVFEALAETDLEKVREELIQVAAVAVKSIETIDRARASGRTARDRHGAVRMVDELVLPGDPVPTCPADGCTPDYCPGGDDCVVSPDHGHIGAVPIFEDGYEITFNEHDLRPTDLEVHNAERVVASAFAPDDVITAADDVLLRAQRYGIRSTGRTA